MRSSMDRFMGGPLIVHKWAVHYRPGLPWICLKWRDLFVPMLIWPIAK